jgi:signal peptide peptidase SppA
MNHRNVLDVLTAPWAIQPEKLVEIQSIYATRLRGETIDIKAIEADIGRPLDNQPKPYTVIDGVAVLPLFGVISKRMNLFSQISGGVSTEMAIRDFNAAMEDPEVRTIVLQIDSPGGTVDGTQALADLVYQARGVKRVVALADGLMASAAYWIGSAAERIYMTDNTTHVGSIGVVTSHTDISGAEAKAGRKTTEIYAGKYKRIDSNYEPLTNAGEAYLQQQVDYIYSVFVNSVARNRGTSVDAVLKNMADGRIFIGQQAIDAGLVDGVSTLDELVANYKGAETMKIITQNTERTNGFESIEQAARREWETDSILRAEFGNRFETYLAYRQAEANGQVRIHGMPAQQRLHGDGVEPIENIARREWDASPDLRGEFANNFSTYLAYRQAEANGQVRVLGKGGCNV